MTPPAVTRPGSRPRLFGERQTPWRPHALVRARPALPGPLGLARGCDPHCHRRGRGPRQPERHPLPQQVLRDRTAGRGRRCSRGVLHRSDRGHERPVRRLPERSGGERSVRSLPVPHGGRDPRRHRADGLRRILHLLCEGPQRVVHLRRQARQLHHLLRRHAVRQLAAQRCRQRGHGDWRVHASRGHPDAQQQRRRRPQPWRKLVPAQSPRVVQSGILRRGHADLLRLSDPERRGARQCRARRRQWQLDQPQLRHRQPVDAFHDGRRLRAVARAVGHVRPGW